MLFENELVQSQTVGVVVYGMSEEERAAPYQTQS